MHLLELGHRRIAFARFVAATNDFRMASLRVPDGAVGEGARLMGCRATGWGRGD